MYFYFICYPLFFSFFFFNDTATTEIYTLSLHDAFRSLSKSHTLKSRISAPIRQPFSPEDCCSSPPHEPTTTSQRFTSNCRWPPDRVGRRHFLRRSQGPLTPDQSFYRGSFAALQVARAQ